MLDRTRRSYERKWVATVVVGIGIIHTAPTTANLNRAAVVVITSKSQTHMAPIITKLEFNQQTLTANMQDLEVREMQVVSKEIMKKIRGEINLIRRRKLKTYGEMT